MPISTINQNGLTNPLTSLASNTVGSASGSALTLQSNGGTTAVTIDTSQRVGIGTSSPTTKLEVSAANEVLASAGIVQIGSTTAGSDVGGQITFRNSDARRAAIAGRQEGAGATAGYLQFGTRGSSGDVTERMRIDSSGNLLVGGTTSYGKLTLEVSGTTSPTNQSNLAPGIISLYNLNGVSTNGTVGIFGWQSGGGIGSGLGFTRQNSADWGSQIRFYTHPTATSNISDVTQRMLIDAAGNIGAPSGTNIYNASDARLKQNIVNLDNCLDKISKLRAVSYNWITDFCSYENEKTLYGFVAQEVEVIDTNLVERFGNDNITVGDKLIENPLRVNEKFIVPMLVKAIQELKAEFDAYKASHP